MYIILIVQTNILFVYLQLNGTVLLLLAQSVNLFVQPMYLSGSAVRHHVVYDHEWMHATSRSWIYGLDTPHFVASGTLRKQGVAPLPETFWDLYSNGDVLWNRLQLVMDCHYNPILQPNKIKRDFENSNFDETLLRQSFSEVISLDGKQRNFDELPH